MSFTATRCDLCGSEAGDLLYPSDIPPEADAALYYSSSRSRAGHLDIVRCPVCGLVRSNPRDDDAELERVYAQMKDDTYEREESNRARTARRRLKRLERLGPPGALLDVGCSTGIFATEAQRQGWRVTGLDPSVWAVAQARLRCPQGLFQAQGLQQASFSPEQFDLISLWDVLEHMPSPRQALKTLLPWLKPGGWLAANLPNAGSLSARLMGPAWVLLLREHLWYFTPATLARLLDECGFELAEARPNLVRYSPANILTRLGQYPGAAAKQAARLAHLPALARIAIPFPIGEMFITARKRN